MLVFFQHTTGAVIVGEHEAGIIADLEDMFERITPTDYTYLHHIRAYDFNGHAHLRAALLPTSVTVPVIQGRFALGTYQAEGAGVPTVICRMSWIQAEDDILTHLTVAGEGYGVPVWSELMIEKQRKDFASGRDACVALRVPVIVEAGAAIVLADLMLQEQVIPRIWRLSHEPSKNP